MQVPAASASRWQLAHVNIARQLHPQGEERVGGFFAVFDAKCEQLAASEGFVRSRTGKGAGRKPDPLYLINLSGWLDVDALAAFACRSGHGPTFARRRKWFGPLNRASLALWWIPQGHQHSVEGLSCPWTIDSFGLGAHAFNFGSRFDPPTAPAEAASV